MNESRKDYITWDEYFMSIVTLAALRSPFYQSGSCIIDKNKRILSVGYDDIPWSIKKYSSENNIEFCTNSLSNAIYTFKGRNQEFEGGTLYTSIFPSYDESRQIAQARLKKVIYLNKNIDPVVEEISNKILYSAGIDVKPYFDDKYDIKEYKGYLKKLKYLIKKHIGKSEEKHLTDDEYFMAITTLSALRSKDPSTQVGACLVDKDNKILSIGYNGTPYGMEDSELPWASYGESTNNLLTTKDPYIVHAEINAFDNYRGNMTDFKASKLYLIYSPCVNCSKRISYAELDKVVYLRKYTKNGVSLKSDRWLNRVNIGSFLYKENHNYSKDECLELFDEYTNTIKKYLKK